MSGLFALDGGACVDKHLSHRAAFRTYLANASDSALQGALLQRVVTMGIKEYYSV
jgi:hypothetical protein